MTNKIALIIVPVSIPINRDERYDRGRHWRDAEHDRNYDILAVQCTDYVPEPGTYDKLIEAKGFKLQILRDIIKQVDISNYHYIGVADDDLILNLDDLNKAIQTTKDVGIPYWQPCHAPGSETIFECSRHDPSCTFSAVNFVEFGFPFFDHERFDILLKLLNNHDSLYVGYGIDYSFADLFQSAGFVYQQCQMYHPPRAGGSTYVNQIAEKEMYEYLNVTYPRIMHEIFNRQASPLPPSPRYAQVLGKYVLSNAQ